MPQRLEIVPLSGPQGADFAAWAAALSAPGGRPLRHAPAAVALTPAGLSEVSTLAWLGDADLLLPEGLVDGSRRLDPVLAECQDAPVRWFLPASDRQALTALPAALMLPEVRVPALDYQSRLNLLMHGLDSRGERVRTAAEDCARRFRLEAPAVRRVTDALVTHPALDAQVMVDACRMEAQLHLGPLAQRVVPRFTADELVLPPAQARQFAEIAQAMRSLARVHHQWGTAKAWNESGLAVLFCGPPGTGKTMAAEALADALDLELYRIDLAQVVDKYIGETEKNLRRIFDAAEASDCILFFDEADALFGKRTEVKDARDRFANIEISYLLERMERFRGLAILATNRRKDLDEAFMRRLRAVIEFPVPGAAERERIWRVCDSLRGRCVGARFRLPRQAVRARRRPHPFNRVQRVPAGCGPTGGPSPAALQGRAARNARRADPGPARTGEARPRRGRCPVRRLCRAHSGVGGMMIEIDRLEIALAGVSALVAEHAVGRPGRGAAATAGEPSRQRHHRGGAGAAASDRSSLRLPPTPVRSGRLIAEQLLEALMRPNARESADRQDGESA